MKSQRRVCRKARRGLPTLMLEHAGDYKQTKAASMYIRFVSGSSTAKDDLLIVPPAMNLSNGEYVGSQLSVDNVELIYE